MRLQIGVAAALSVAATLPMAARRQPPASADMAAIARQADGYVDTLQKRIAGKEDLPAEQVFENIRTFKGMPAGRLLRVMRQAFVPNVGVGCEYCHDVENWASDAKKPKGIARGMWTMRADVQQRVRDVTGNADAIVTCYTCHKGQPKPAFK